MSRLTSYHGPATLKTMTDAELVELCGDVRWAILKRVSTVGGHLASNLGTVELITALYATIDPLTARVVYDGAHQAYTHKILVDRLDAFTKPELFKSIGTATSTNESVYDHVTFGHGGFGASALCGFARAEPARACVLVLSDACLGTGISFEGLNNIAELKRNVVVVINDNDHSIMANVGGVYKSLAALRESAGSSELNFFKTLGFDYVHVANGHSVTDLRQAFATALLATRPVVVHVVTVKGKGYAAAEANPTAWHYSNGGFDLLRSRNNYFTGSALNVNVERSISVHVDRKLAELVDTGVDVLAVTPAMPDVGFGELLRSRTGHYVDVGIAEEHAAVEAVTAALAGRRPVVGTYSTFFQRMIDPILNVAVPNHANVVFLLHETGLNDSKLLQQGVYDVALANLMHDVTIFATVSALDTVEALEYALTNDLGPVVVRLPAVVGDDVHLDHDWRVVRHGRSVLILAVGDLLELGQVVADELDATLVNPQQLTAVNLVDGFLDEVDLVVTLENGVLDGGFGQRVATRLASTQICCLTCGVPAIDYSDPMTDYLAAKLDGCGLTSHAVVAKVKALMNSVDDDISEKGV